MLGALQTLRSVWHATQTADRPEQGGRAREDGEEEDKAGVEARGEGEGGGQSAEVVCGKAKELLQLMAFKCSPGSLGRGEICRPFLALDFATRVLALPQRHKHVEALRRLSSVPLAVYEDAFRVASTALGDVLRAAAAREASLAALSCRYGTGDLLRAHAERALAEWKRMYVDQLPSQARSAVDVQRPVYQLGAFFVAAKALRIKKATEDRETLCRAVGVSMQEVRSVMSSIEAVTGAGKTKKQKQREQERQDAEKNKPPLRAADAAAAAAAAASSVALPPRPRQHRRDQLLGKVASTRAPPPHPPPLPLPQQQPQGQQQQQEQQVSGKKRPRISNASFLHQLEEANTNALDNRQVAVAQRHSAATASSAAAVASAASAVATHGAATDAAVLGQAQGRTTTTSVGEDHAIHDRGRARGRKGGDGDGESDGDGVELCAGLRLKRFRRGVIEAQSDTDRAHAQQMKSLILKRLGRASAATSASVSPPSANAETSPSGSLSAPRHAPHNNGDDMLVASPAVVGSEGGGPNATVASARRRRPDAWFASSSSNSVPSSSSISSSSTTSSSSSSSTVLPVP